MSLLKLLLINVTHFSGWERASWNVDVQLWRTTTTTNKVLMQEVDSTKEENITKTKSHCVLSTMCAKSLLQTRSFYKGKPKYLPRFVVWWNPIMDVNFTSLGLEILEEAKNCDFWMYTSFTKRTYALVAFTKSLKSMLHISFKSIIS